jgi:steroid delta-isomerase-like uncharacterized protein
MNIEARVAAPIQIVDEHIRQENDNDLAGIMGTFGKTARFDDEPFNAHHVGHQDVRALYASLLQALPGLRLDLRWRHVALDADVLEIIVRGVHLGAWRGLPPTGRQVELPLCGIFTFDEADRLAGESAYYDRATLLRQLGIFPEPESVVGRIATVVMHPHTWRGPLAEAFGGEPALRPADRANDTTEMSIVRPTDHLTCLARGANSCSTLIAA